MKNVKIASFAALAGFILSLVFGLFSGSGILKVLLTALCSALFFGVLFIGIAFIYERFLVIESSDSEAVGSATVNNTSSPVGNNVDIVIEDQELEQSDSSNRYSVGDNYSMLNESDIKSGSAVNSSSTIKVDSGSGFVPVRNLETLTNFSSTEAVKPDEPKKNGNSINSDELDVLPDFDDVSVKTSPAVIGDAQEDSFDSGFADAVSSANYTRKSDVDTDKFQNTELIAKAISSVLSNEE